VSLTDTEVQIVAGFKGQCDCHIYHDTHAPQFRFTPARSRISHLRQLCGRDNEHSALKICPAPRGKMPQTILTASSALMTGLSAQRKQSDLAAIDDIASVEPQRATVAKFAWSIAALGNPRTHHIRSAVRGSLREDRERDGVETSRPSKANRRVRANKPVPHVFSTTCGSRIRSANLS
jgi:hypothetical protein